ncbi:RNA-binding domain-containing protein [Pantoea cypripedii]|nr:RNA-binding domain-containing protein [Pantoea cypripedii]ORM94606.1 transcriptional regulator [Pantoea cypripedii]
MIDLKRNFSLKGLIESHEIECKLANGKDGNGAVPDDMWSTYSAMANTNGGLILLGVREKKGVFSVAGINDIERVKKDFFNTINNPQKISICLVDDSKVHTKLIDDKNIIIVEVPQANRKQRPVYVNSNPLTGTYLRLHEGDRKCSSEQVKAMLAEQLTDTLDDRIFNKFTIDDLDKSSIQIYRNLLSSSKPDHVWLELDDFEFIKSLKGWRKDRNTGVEGLTLAGLLMFGKWQSIQDALPQYFIEYQDITDNQTIDDNTRWNDRLIPDGSWSGNLFDFYRKVYRKLTEDLKIPFSISGGVRTSDSPVHVALREALVNTLVHADYNGHSPIKIVKQNGIFTFRNPGTMRVPFVIAKNGGESDCRNKYLHQMFLMIGLGERAGSGLPKIFSGWKSQHWSEPKLIENFESNNTRLELSTEGFIPKETIEKLKEICGSKFKSLNELDRVILATAAQNDIVSHEEIREITSYDTRKITLSLSKLVRLSF